MGQAPYSAELVPLGLLFAVVFARTFPVRWFTRTTINAALAAAGVLSGVALVHEGWSTWTAALAVLVGVAGASTRVGVPRAPAISWRLSFGAVAVTSVLGSVVGASSASATW